MNPKQIRMLMASEHSSLKKEQVQALTSNQIQIVEDILKPYTIRHLRRGQIRALSLDLIRHNLTTAHFQQLSHPQIQAFTKGQLQAIPPEQMRHVGLIKLRQDQLSLLTAEQKRGGLNARNFKRI